MLSTKISFKTVFLISFTFLCISSCSEDSSSDDQKPNEIVVEDFANFEKDPKLIEYVDEMAINLDQRFDLPKVDLTTASRLAEIIELTETQKEELAIALGFDSSNQMEEYNQGRIKKWQQLETRFDLKNQKEDDVNEVITDVFMELIERVANKNPNKLDTSKGPMDWWCTECYIPYRNRTKERVRRRSDRAKSCLEQFELNGDDEQFFKCNTRNRRIDDVILLRNHFNMICCFYEQCGIAYIDDIYNYCEEPDEQIPTS